MSKRKKGNFLVSVVVLALVAGAAFFVYQRYFAGKVHFKDKNYMYFFIGSKDSFEDVLGNIGSEGIIENMESFEWLAKKMKLDENIHGGRYRITNGMDMRQIINLLKYNKQEKIKLTFNSQIHDLEEFVSYVDDKLELTGGELEDFITDEKRLHENFRLDPDNAFALLVPGTLEVSWAISMEEFVSRLKERYDKVWNPSRLARAGKINFTPAEITTIASIVQSESAIRSEQEKIAGVYINRLKRGMPLQADPTLKFANKNYEALRVLDVDKQINSPYNTYKYKGLPPGPICLVSQGALDATLYYTSHNYIYFCAKPQLNGYSDFSATFEQHKKYAAAYRKAMDKMGITR